MNKDRRRFIQAGFAGGSSIALGGCASLFGPCVDPEDFQISCRGIIHPVFDTHTHFFNAADLQAGGYITGPMLNELRPDLPRSVRRLVVSLGEIFQTIVEVIAPSAQREKDKLENIGKSFASESSLQLMEFENSSFAEEQSARFFEMLREFEKNLPDSEKFQNLYRQAQQDQFGVLKLDDVDVFTQDSLTEAIKGKFEGTDIKSLQGFVPGVSFDVSILKFFIARGLSYRSANMNLFRQTFTPDSPSENPSVVRVVDIAIDFDYWLGEGESRSSMDDQIALKELMSRKFGGYNVPMLGFNPYKFIEDVRSKGDTYLQRIEKTLDRGVFKGIKIYPTLGYSPYGEVVSDIRKTFWRRSGWELPDTRSMRNAFEDMYAILNDKEAIITAHTKRSMGVSDDAKDLVGARKWDQLIQDYPDMKVNLGHLGHLSGSDEYSTSAYFELLKSPNVYGDLGNWSELQSDTSAKSLVSLMREHGEEIFEKVTYGSDWYMIGTEDTWRNYLDGAWRTLTKYITETERDQLFFNNAANLYQSIPEDCQST